MSINIKVAICRVKKDKYRSRVCSNWIQTAKWIQNLSLQFIILYLTTIFSACYLPGTFFGTGSQK